jgi:hypothetical protein
MNIEAQELADNLRATARTMDESAKKMKEFWKKYRNHRLLVHINEIDNAASICGHWADCIEAEYCEADGKYEFTKCDPDEAPEGCYAKQSKSCCMCVCFDNPGPCPREGHGISCIAKERKDGCDVIFLKREERKTP